MTYHNPQRVPAGHDPYVLFRCEKDDCWIVSRWQEGHSAKSGYYLGVAECPDERTALDVMKAMQHQRQRRKEVAK